MPPAPTVVVLQHTRTEHGGILEAALQAEGCTIDRCNVRAGDPVPESAKDALLVLGGPQAAYDDRGFPTRRAELALIRDTVAAGTPVLGVCLGAQLLAEACGGAATAGHGPEIGWAPVSLTGAPDPLFDGLATEFVPLHWHGDTFVPPPASVVVASSAAYPFQAVRVGPRAWGIQFHLEVDEAMVGAFVAADPDGAARGGGTAIVDQAPERLRALEPLAGTVAARFAALVSRPAQ